MNCSINNQEVINCPDGCPYDLAHVTVSPPPCASFVQRALALGARWTGPVYYGGTRVDTPSTFFRIVTGPTTFPADWKLSVVVE